MQAIILAAGMGRRLGELTKHNTKCMIEVNGVKLIDRMLTQLSRLSLSRVVIVIGYEGEKLKNYIGNRYDDVLKIEYVVNPVYDKTNNIYSLALAKQQMQEDDTLLLESDLILSDNMLPMLVESKYSNAALVAKYQPWMDGTMVCIDDDGNILNFVPKKAFRYEDTDTYYKTVNVYKFSRSFSTDIYVPFLEAYSKALGLNEYYEQVLRIITLINNTGLKAIPVGPHDHWYEIDDVQDLDIAEAIFAQGEERLKRFYGRYGGYWRFPQMLDFCYLVNPYYPSPRMLDELRANFDTLLTEYPSGMRICSLIAGKCFGVKQDYIIPGNGAAEFIKVLMESTEGRVGVTYPTFEEYPNRLETSQREVFRPTNPDFHYDETDLISYFTAHPVDTLLLINPDNPSGNFISMQGVERLLKWTQERGMRIVIDESFVDFSHDYAHNSLLHNEVLERNPHLIVVKSISKSFGIPGLRLGIMATADADVVAKVRSTVSIWNLNSFAEYFMQIFNKYEADYQTACEKFQKERDYLMQGLQKIPYLRVIPSEANYFLCEVLPPYRSREWVTKLLCEHDILLKDCSTKMGFDGRQFVRIAVRNRRDNDMLLEALQDKVEKE